MIPFNNLVSLTVNKKLLTTLYGEILRFILHAKIPLEKFVREELAGRGYDENFKWVGFEEAEKIWLK